MAPTEDKPQPDVQQPAQQPSEEETSASTTSQAGQTAPPTPPPAEGQITPAAAAAVAASTEVADGAMEKVAEGGPAAEEDIAVYITVYPPPQSGSAPLVLESLAGVEIVIQVKALLAELPQTCVYSAYQLVAVTPKVVEGGGDAGGGVDVGAGEEAADEADVWKGGGDVMNDFAELKSIPAVLARPQKVQVRMELDPYNMHTARQHVQKFRDLLRYPPPCAEGFGSQAKSSGAGSGKKGRGSKSGGGRSKKAKQAAAAAAKEQAAAAAAGEAVNNSTPTSPVPEESGSPALASSTVAGDDSPKGKVVATPGADPAADDMAQRVQRAMDIRGRLKDSRVPVGGQGLGGFYGVGLGLAVDEVALPSKDRESGSNNGRAGDRDLEPPIVCLRGVSISAWNPPPPQRKMAGDLLYLEVITLDSNVIHISGTQTGFYVNGTRKDNFDPTPAAHNPCHSHELTTCVLNASPSFAKAWNNAVTQAWRRAQMDDPVHALARAMREGRGDAVMVKPQWNCPVPEIKWWGHKADSSRAQEDLTHGFGMEDRGVPREWNDEYQSLLELPNDTSEQVMTRSRALWKLLGDFQEAATAGALAISDGHIPAANPTEPEHSHVFVFNNIFFSYAADSPDAYKAVSGEAAARKSASQDLASVVALNSLSEAFHPQLSIKTLATAVIDYSGRRMIAQSLVPGILNGDQTSKVVYGAMEHGQPLRSNEKVSELLRQVGQRLMIAERELEAVPIKALAPADPADPAAAAAAEGEARKENGEKAGGQEGEGQGQGEEEEERTPSTVMVTGAVEMKGIVGSDARSYLLDVSRLTPRDANWVRGEKGTGVYKKWLEACGDKPISLGEWEGRDTDGKAAVLDTSFEDMTVLRPELLTMFTRHKLAEWYRERDAGKNEGTEERDAEETLMATATPLKALTAEEDESAASKGDLTTREEASKEENAPTANKGEEEAAVEGDKAEGVAAVAEGAVALDESKGGERGDEEGGGEAVSALRMSEEEVEKLREEQEARCRELAMNVNVFMPYKGCVDEQQLAADESLAREAARYLWDEALPFVTTEVKRGSLCPLDCAELATSLHGAGINLRYMGRLAAVALIEEKEDRVVRAEGKLRRWRMPLFWLEMLETEMVARAVTHVFNRYMAVGSSTMRGAPGRAIRKFLNCLLGGPSTTRGKYVETATGNAEAGAGGAAAAGRGVGGPAKAGSTSWKLTSHGEGVVDALTQAGLWASLTAEVAARFRHDLVIWGPHLRKAEAAKDRAHKLPLLRRVCQRLGLRVLSRSYEFDTLEPVDLDDVVNVFPVVKSCLPSSPISDAVEALEMAQLHLGSGGGLQTAHDLAQHAANMLLQACEGMHPKYPTALTLQARVMYHSGDADAAVAYQLKALAYFEQLEGLDSTQVIKSHEFLGQYYIMAGLYDRALAHMRAFCYLVELTAGPHHPELASGYHKMGRAYQEVGSVMMALRCYQEALERQAGDHMISPRVHHNVAETLESIGGYTDALKHERLSHAGYKAVHGEEHPLVVKSTKNIRALTTQIVKAAQDPGQQQVPGALMLQLLQQQLQLQQQPQQTNSQQRSSATDRRTGPVPPTPPTTPVRHPKSAPASDPVIPVERETNPATARKLGSKKVKKKGGTGEGEVATAEVDESKENGSSGKDAESSSSKRK